MSELAAYRAVSEAFARTPEQEHSLACLINAAVRLHCRALEQVGAGMSDKVAREPFVTAPGGQEIIDRYRADRDAARAAEIAEEASGGICGRGEGDTRPTGLKTATASISTHSAANCAQSVNPHPITPPRGEHKPLPMLIDREWCREKIAADQDVPCEAGRLRPGNALTDEERLARARALGQARAAEREAEQRKSGITHGDGSPIAAKHSGPSDRCVPRFKSTNPEDLGNGA